MMFTSEAIRIREAKNRILAEIPLFEGSEQNLQKTYALLLRRLGIKYLRFGQGLLARNFRGEYLPKNVNESWDEFLRRQARNRAWGTYIEGAALAEMLGFNFVVTYVDPARKKHTMVIRRDENPEAKTIHLMNDSNVHWSVEGSNTIGDGNCLYNAFAQELKRIYPSPAQKSAATIERARQQEIRRGETVRGEEKPLTTERLTLAEEKIKESQKEIERLIMAAKRPSELEEELNAEQERIKKLPAEEQEQIAEDYRLALRLAAEEMGVEEYQKICSPTEEAMNRETKMMPTPKPKGIRAY
ncbi:MAG: hypothetical protein JW855_01715 [Gammaproteobacteria bacterium]|nr:hypothetical protein [Gammaproteobacteria bacterium]